MDSGSANACQVACRHPADMSVACGCGPLACHTAAFPVVMTLVSSCRSNSSLHGVAQPRCHAAVHPAVVDLRVQVACWPHFSLVPAQLFITASSRFHALTPGFRFSQCSHGLCCMLPLALLSLTFSLRSNQFLHTGTQPCSLLMFPLRHAALTPPTLLGLIPFTPKSQHPKVRYGRCDLVFRYCRSLHSVTVPHGPLLTWAVASTEPSRVSRFRPAGRRCS